jgi:hypothetical protein
MPSSKVRALDWVSSLLSVAALAFLLLSYMKSRAAESNPLSADLRAAELMGKPLSEIAIFDSAKREASFKPASVGSASVYILFKTTCPACEAVALQWKSMIDSLPKGVRSVAVCTEETSVAREWLERHHISVDTVLRPADRKRYVNQWQAKRIPMTIVSDPQGKVVYSSVGALDGAERAIRQIQTVKSELR